MSRLVALLLLALPVGSVAAVAASPAQLISEFRVKNGEGRVTMDATLNAIAQDQAKAMAAKDSLDHDVLGSFTSRIARANAGRAAENIAYGYDSFDKTLAQWIDSSGHRKNLLLPKATRVGIASATSAATHRIYWAMEIAGDYETTRPAVASRPVKPAPRKPAAASCRFRILGVCL
jgi:uncharacterized protein YkwD